VRHPIVNIAVTAARAGAREIIRYLNRLDQISAHEKQQNDFVSEVDHAAERAIIDVIRRHHPRDTILAEESGRSGNNKAGTWIVDPLDGTTNFLHGVGHFAISVAYQEKDQLEHGVIYDPTRDELFIASRGRGAFVNDKRMRVNASPALSGSLLATGFPFRNRDLMDDFMAGFTALYAEVGDIRRMGSAALDLAYIAAGRLDGFWEYGLQPWDLAAGMLMVSEAGGRSMNFAGGEDCLEHGNIIAGNLKIADAMLATLAPTLAEGEAR